MKRKHFLIITGAALALASGIALAACGSTEDAPAGAKKMSFQLTDAGCEPQDAKAPAGPIAFEIENAGTSKVTEMEIMEGEKVLGEEENITEGLSGSFSLTLGAGEYTIYCPGGESERGTLTVTGAEHVEGERPRRTRSPRRGSRDQGAPAGGSCRGWGTPPMGLSVDQSFDVLSNRLIAKKRRFKAKRSGRPSMRSYLRSLT